jgi:hypothetical protein
MTSEERKDTEKYLILAIQEVKKEIAEIKKRYEKYK